MEFLKEAANLISTLSSAVEREIYGGRVAAVAGISPEAMKLEIEKAVKRRVAMRTQAAAAAVAGSPLRSQQPENQRDLL